MRSSLPMIGVRAPVIQALAKELAASPKEFLDSYRAENFEQILLYSLTLAKCKLPFEDKCRYFDGILPKYENWAVVDMTLGAFKDLRKHREEFLQRYEWLCTGGEFERRVMAIFLMDYCLDEKMLDTVFGIYEKLGCGMYYTDMGIAWGISVALVKFYDQTVEFLRRTSLSDFIVNKSIQKARESFRISPERKTELLALKRTKN